MQTSLIANCNEGKERTVRKWNKTPLTYMHTSTHACAHPRTAMCEPVRQDVQHAHDGDVRQVAHRPCESKSSLDMQLEAAGRLAQPGEQFGEGRAVHAV